jgi:hypothetical protein
MKLYSYLIKIFNHYLKLSNKGRIGLKLIVFLIVLSGMIYFIYSFPEQSILVISIGLILLIGIWLKEAYGE